MPTPVPSPLHSALNWLKASHLRLLVAGLVSVGLIASVSIFAAGSPDKLAVTISKDGGKLSQDFRVTTRYKPKKGRNKFNVRVTLDGQRIDNRVYNKPKSNVTGKQNFVYNFQYGASANNSKRSKRFELNLLQPGEHELKAIVCKNVAPDERCKRIKRVTKKFTVESTPAVQSWQEPATVIEGLNADQPVEGRDDDRVSSVSDIRGNTNKPGQNPDSRSTSLIDRTLTRFVDTAVAHDGKNAKHGRVIVNVNFTGTQSDGVAVTVDGCHNDNTRGTGPDGHVEFNNCTAGENRHMHVDPRVEKGGVTYVADNPDQGGFLPNNDTLRFFVTYTPVQGPGQNNPAPTQPGNQNPPGPADGDNDKREGTIHVDVDPALSVNVTVAPGNCAEDSKRTGDDGKVTFRKCKAGVDQTVTVDKFASKDDNFYQAKDASKSKQLGKDDTINFNFQYEEVDEEIVPGIAFEMDEDWESFFEVPASELADHNNGLVRVAAAADGDAELDYDSEDIVPDITYGSEGSDNLEDGALDVDDQIDQEDLLLGAEPEDAQSNSADENIVEDALTDAEDAESDFASDATRFDAQEQDGTPFPLDPDLEYDVDEIVKLFTVQVAHAAGTPKDEAAKDKKDGKGRIKVLAVRVKANGQKVRLNGVKVNVKPKCAQKRKTTAGHSSKRFGTATFRGCPAGEHTLRVVAPQGYQLAPGENAKKKVNVKAGKKTKRVFRFVRAEAGGTDAPAQKINRAPMLAVTKVECQKITMDAFMLRSGKKKNQGGLKAFEAQVDGQSVSYEVPAKQAKRFPTLRNQFLELPVTLCDNDYHEVVLTAVGQNNKSRSITMNVYGEGEEVVDPCEAFEEALLNEEVDEDERPAECAVDEPVAGEGTLEINKFEDIDGNGEENESEPPMEGVGFRVSKVTDDNLDNPERVESAELVGTFETDENGMISENLSEGVYLVTEEVADDDTIEVNGRTFLVTTGFEKEAEISEDETSELSFGNIDVSSPEAPNPSPSAAPGSGSNAGAGAQKGFGSLPVTGQLGIIAFLTFLGASAAYYGTQYYRRRRASRSGQ